MMGRCEDREGIMRLPDDFGKRWDEIVSERIPAGARKYASMPVEVDAVPFAGNGTAIVAWLGRRYVGVTAEDDAPALRFSSDVGERLIRPGQWLVRLPSGDFTVVNDVEFHRTYAEVL